MQFVNHLAFEILASDASSPSTHQSQIEALAAPHREGCEPKWEKGGGRNCFQVQDTEILGPKFASNGTSDFYDNIF